MQMSAYSQLLKQHETTAAVNYPERKLRIIPLCSYRNLSFRHTGCISKTTHNAIIKYKQLKAWKMCKISHHFRQKNNGFSLFFQTNDHYFNHNGFGYLCWHSWLDTQRFDGGKKWIVFKSTNQDYKTILIYFALGRFHHNHLLKGNYK